MLLHFTFSNLADFTLTVQALDTLASVQRARGRDQTLPPDEREISFQLAHHASRIAREMEQRSTTA